MQKKPAGGKTCMKLLMNAFMFILRKACEANRTGDCFTNEKTAFELSFYKISQIEPESFGSESCAPYT